jgi:hypothetical protein
VYYNVAQETKFKGNRWKKWTNREIRNKLRCDSFDSNTHFKSQRRTSSPLDRNPNNIFLTDETIREVLLYLDQNMGLADADVNCSVTV